MASRARSSPARAPASAGEPSGRGFPHKGSACGECRLRAHESGPGERTAIGRRVWICARGKQALCIGNSSGTWDTDFWWLGHELSERCRGFRSAAQTEKWERVASAQRGGRGGNSAGKEGNEWWSYLRRLSFWHSAVPGYSALGDLLRVGLGGACGLQPAQFGNVRVQGGEVEQDGRTVRSGSMIRCGSVHRRCLSIALQTLKGSQLSDIAVLGAVAQCPGNDQYPWNDRHSAHAFIRPRLSKPIFDYSRL